MFEVIDDWSRARDVDPTLSLRIKVNGGKFKLLGTTATIATMLGVGQRIGALVDEKRAAADAVIASAGLPPRPTAAAKAENAISRVASRLGRDTGEQPECPVAIVNHLEFNVEAIGLAMFQDRWNDGDVYRADAGSGIRATLVRDVDSDHQVHRDLGLFLGFFSIRRVAHRKLAPTEEGQFGVEEWYDLLRKSKETSIMKHAATDVKMESWEAPGSYHIRHNFKLNFGGHTDVALNVRLLPLSSQTSPRRMLDPDAVPPRDTRSGPFCAISALSRPSTAYRWTASARRRPRRRPRASRRRPPLSHPCPRPCRRTLSRPGRTSSNPARSSR